MPCCLLSLRHAPVLSSLTTGYQLCSGSMPVISVLHLRFRVLRCQWGWQVRSVFMSEYCLFLPRCRSPTHPLPHGLLCTQVRHHDQPVLRQLRRLHHRLHQLQGGQRPGPSRRHCEALCPCHRNCAGLGLPCNRKLVLFGLRPEWPRCSPLLQRLRHAAVCRPQRSAALVVGT